MNDKAPGGESKGWDSEDRFRAASGTRADETRKTRFDQSARQEDLATMACEINLLIVSLQYAAILQDRALSYLSQPGSNRLLGRAVLSRAISKRSRILRRLDRDRQCADRLLGEMNAGKERTTGV